MVDVVTDDPYARFRAAIAGQPLPPRPRPAGLATATGDGPLAGLVALVAGKPEGERNAALHWAACRAGEHVAAGRLDEQQAVDALSAAAHTAGLGGRETARTIRSGMTTGKDTGPGAKFRTYVAEHKAGTVSSETPVAAGARVVRVADVVAERVTWIWPGYLPAGKLVVIDGDPGVGKSTVTLDLAARISTGSAMPDGAPCARPGVVLLLSAEDGVADTIRPRLDAAGADPEQVHVLTEIATPDGGRPVDLATDLADIAAVIRTLGAVLVVIDPLMAFLGGAVDSHRDQDVRRVLHPLSKLAEQTGVTFVVVRHMNKATGGNVLYRGGGSIGIIGAARMGYVVAPDPEDDSRRVFAPTKSNVAPMPAALGYQLAQDDDHGVARVVWAGRVDRLAADLLRPARDADERTERDEAADWLSDYLEINGKINSRDAKKAGRAAGHAEATIRRAAQSLSVVIDAVGFPRQTFWSLPAAVGSNSSGLTKPQWAHSRESEPTDPAVTPLDKPDTDPAVPSTPTASDDEHPESPIGEVPPMPDWALPIYDQEG